MWRDWSEFFIDYLEEFSKPMAGQLEAAARTEDVITPTYVNEQCRNVAESTYKILRTRIREPDGKRLVRSFKGTKNAYEV